MREKINKIIKIQGTDSAWGNSTRDNTIISLEINKNCRNKRTQDNVATISMDKIKGSDITINQFIDILFLDSDILKSAFEYISNTERKESFFVDTYEGISGCRKYTLYTSGWTNTDVVRKDYKRCEIYISMFDKVDLGQIKNIWIGDLIEILIHEDPDFIKFLSILFFGSKNNLKKMRIQSGISYIKRIIPQKKISMDNIIDTFIDEIIEEDDISELKTHIIFENKEVTFKKISDSRFASRRKWKQI